MNRRISRAPACNRGRLRPSVSCQHRSAGRESAVVCAPAAYISGALRASYSARPQHQTYLGAVLCCCGAAIQFLGLTRERDVQNRQNTNRKRRDSKKDDEQICYCLKSASAYAWKENDATKLSVMCKDHARVSPGTWPADD